jgi:hypothetical protein
MDWRKSSFSSNGGQACVEVASANGVAVRDTTNRDAGTLNFPAAAWRSFLTGIKHG